MKLFFVGGVLGFAVGMAITVMYFSLTTLFAANAKFAATRADRQREAFKERDIPISALAEKAQGVGA